MNSTVPSVPMVTSDALMASAYPPTGYATILLTATMDPMNLTVLESVTNSISIVEMGNVSI